ncbi:hypothetical protein SDC9_181022 [bioreactor metagenome]|uniref:Uncharacterized protein n=1 Tax=bioreactor metagenome TaxID=1076179 RepID=A0A645HBR7_9ZZZZ|nr:hypothetical protein CMETHOX_32590 [[Clostridium] methoxybenzovorans]
MVSAGLVVTVMVSSAKTDTQKQAIKTSSVHKNETLFSRILDSPL